MATCGDSCKQSTRWIRRAKLWSVLPAQGPTAYGQQVAREQHHEEEIDTPKKTRPPLMTSVRIAVLGLFVLANLLQGASLKPRYRLKPQGLSKWITSAIAFSPNGELYILYDKSKKKDTASSTLVIQVYDGETGGLLRLAEIVTPEIPRPRWFEKLEISPDGQLALFVDAPGRQLKGGRLIPGGKRIGVVDTGALSLLTTAVIPERRMESSRIFGFSHTGNTVQVAIGQTVEDDEHPLGITSRVRSTELDSRDLTRTVSERVAENPFPSYGYEIDPWNSIWFYDANLGPPASLHRFQPRDGHVNVVRAEGLLGFMSVLFLPEAVLGFTFQGEAARYEPAAGKAPVATYHADGCGFEVQATLSSDGRIAASLCTASGTGIFDTIKTIVARAIVLDAKTLQPMAWIRISKKHSRRWVAVSHRHGRTLVAVFDSSRHVSVYELGDPREDP